MRGLLERLVGFLIRIFFRRIELDGPAPSGSVVYALNHPNALVDPVFILCFAPQRVSFLAKAPVFRMPLIGALVRAFDCLPVYRTQDGADPADNRRTLDAARAILGRGGAIALFPEGTSHSDPMLRPLKTGAARIALAANALGGPAEAVPVVPVGLHYTAKGRFRSEALVSYGAPIVVERVELDAAFEPPAAAVHALTARIERELAALTLHASSARALDLAGRAERIFSAADDERRAGTLADGRALRQRFVDGLAQLEASDPTAVRRVLGRITRYEGTLARLGLEPEHPTPEAFGWRRSLGFAARNLLALVVGAPLALVGTLIHAPAYYLIRFLSFRIARDPDMPATVKLLGALLFFPLTWLAIGVAVGVTVGPLGGVAAAVLAPALGHIALITKERLERAYGAARSLWLFATRRRLLGFLGRERRAIRDEITALAARLEPRP